MDFRSDTTTRPSPEMRQAMSEADVGDDVYGEDPTILRLQRDAAAMTGKEAALFVCSGTMGNLLAVLAHCSERGSEVVVGNESHVYVYEAGGMSVLGGVPFNVLQNKDNGELDLDDLAAAIRPADQHAAMTRCICIETTHNRCGGAVLSLEYLQRLKALAKSKHLVLHLDGARVFNAATALGVPVSDICSCVDTVQFCLSKGLGAPVGSIVAGPAPFVAKVHRLRKMVGGGMRQAGVLAAPGLIALHKMTKRLHEDHENARTLATGIAKLPWAQIDLAAVQTNIVCFRVASPLSPQGLLAHLAANGIQALAFRGGVRMVTHLDVSAQDVSKALAVLGSAQAQQANGHHKPVEVQAAPSADGAVADRHSAKPAYKEY